MCKAERGEGTVEPTMSEINGLRRTLIRLGPFSWWKKEKTHFPSGDEFLAMTDMRYDMSSEANREGYGE